MEKKINLIPADLAVNSLTNRVKNGLSTASLVGALATVVMIAALTVMAILYNSRLNNLERSITSLKSQVTQLEASEQRLVLAKDRLNKIKAIRQDDSATDEISVYKQMAGKSGSEVKFTEVNIESKKLESSVLSTSSQPISAFLKSLTEITGVKKIILSTLSFSPTSGYLAGLIFESEGVAQ